MDFSLTEEQTAVRDLAAKIIGDHSSHEALRALERSGNARFDRELWSKLADAGLLGIALPESVGGAGLGLVELAGILEQAGKFAAAVPLWETLGLGALPIAEFASKAVADHWLPRVADGTAILTAAWHDEVGDPLSPLTTASASGDAWTVTGTKVCVPAGEIADAVVVVASTPEGPGLFLVETNATGVSRESIRTTTAKPDAMIEFSGAPAECLTIGRDAVQWAFDRAMGTQCAVALGNCEAALDLTASYTKDRKQFGVPIASFQAVGHRAADAFIDTEAIRLTTWQALWRLDNGMSATEEVAIAKYWAAFGGQRVVHSAAHLHGGVGVDRDYPLHRYFLAAKELELQLGGATPSLLRLGALIAANA